MLTDFDPSTRENRRYRDNQPFKGNTLIQISTNRFLQSLRRDNSYLSITRTYENDLLDGEKALRASLEGVSPLTGERELVEVFTRLLPNDQIICLIFIAPGQRHRELEELTDRVLSSLSINDHLVQN